VGDRKMTYEPPFKPEDWVVYPTWRGDQRFQIKSIFAVVGDNDVLLRWNVYALQEGCSLEDGLSFFYDPDLRLDPLYSLAELGD
jgi:hypothetical protein